MSDVIVDEANPLAVVRVRLEHTPDHLAHGPIAVLEVRRAATPLQMPLRRLRSEDLAIMHEAAQPFFADISDHLLRVIDHVEYYDRLLTDVLHAHLAQISAQQNNDMRRISARVSRPRCRSVCIARSPSLAGCSRPLRWQ